MHGTPRNFPESPGMVKFVLPQAAHKARFAQTLPPQ
jgi:hypothetical protein